MEDIIMTLINRNANTQFLPYWVGDFFSPETREITRNFLDTPPVNIFQNENSFRIELATPGLSKEDIKIILEKNILKISSEKESQEPESKEDCTKKEYSFMKFVRAFTLPKNADIEKISAKSENGILTVVIQKQEITAKPTRDITID